MRRKWLPVLLGFWLITEPAIAQDTTTTAPSNPIAKNYADSFRKSVQDNDGNLDDVNGTLAGDTHGPFKLWFFDDNNDTCTTYQRGSQTFTGCNMDDGGSNIQFQVGSTNRSASWLDGLEAILKAGTKLAQIMTNPFLLALAGLVSILLGLLMVFSGKAVEGATVIFRVGVIVLFCLPIPGCSSGSTTKRS